jgi:nitroimidazol reductase NimA-like FMN-containing flavoprotein (pyridoxamine 5'-phosphate oxidase superfamily)
VIVLPEERMLADMETQTISAEEAIRLLATAPIGRIVFTMRALPAVLPVNFVVHNGAVAIRTGAGSKLTAAVRNAVVAFQADQIDPVQHAGWSVTVIGRVIEIRDPAEKERLRPLLQPWASGEKEHFLRIVPELAGGVRLTPASMLAPA